MSNLENLRKQAKQVLRWHRERHWPIAAQIRDVLPDYRELDDRQVFERDFKLADAQAYVAKRAGFESWETLKANADSQSDAQDRVSSGQLLDAKPFVYVSDIDAACAFFGRLGFEVAFKYGEPPFYAEVYRDAVRLSVRHADERDRVPVERRRAEQLLSATIVVDSPKPLYQEFLARGVPFFQTLRTQPWGKQDFIVEDDDGNLIAFAEP